MIDFYNLKKYEIYTDKNLILYYIDIIMIYN